MANGSIQCPFLLRISVWLPQSLSRERFVPKLFDGRIAETLLGGGPPGRSAREFLVSACSRPDEFDRKSSGNL